MSDSVVERIKSALPGEWWIVDRAPMGVPSVGRLYGLCRPGDGELLRVSINPPGRWWRLGNTEIAPSARDIEVGWGKKDYRGRGYLERMVRDATEAAELAAGLREENEE